MKKLSFMLLAALTLLSCAPVLREDLMKKGTFDANFSEIKDNPGIYKGRLFILGGVIARTTATDKGSMIEVMYLPVDSRGYLRGVLASHERFLAISPGRFLDPLIFSKGREVTVAGKFADIRNGKIDEMEYVYPLFEIEELYLWEERKDYYYVEPYPYWYSPYPFWWYDPWWRHHR